MQAPGPYVMKEFVPGSHYTLERSEGYWVKSRTSKPSASRSLPEISTQKLQLDQGAFDLVAKGFAIPDVAYLQEEPRLQHDHGARFPRSSCSG